MSLEEAVQFSYNPEPRCPCILLLDISESMKGESIGQLNAGLRLFQDNLMRDPVASKRVDVAIVTFSSVVTVVQEFISITEFRPPMLIADGYTHMGSGILEALWLLQTHKQALRKMEVDYFRPHVFMITDGRPESEPDHIVEEATRRIHEEEARKGVMFFAIAVRGADLPRLRQIVVREPVDLSANSFMQVIDYLSKSVSALSQARYEEGQQRPLPPPGT